MRILVLQQNGSGERKIKGIKRYGGGLFAVEIISLEAPLPTLLDDTGDYLPDDIQAELVLDFLKHPDLSHDLALACARNEIPVIASGKVVRVRGVLNPPT